MIGKRKFFKVYSGPGYPIDPKLEEERMHPDPIVEPESTALLIARKMNGPEALPNWLFAQRN